MGFGFWFIIWYYEPSLKTSAIAREERVLLTSYRQMEEMKQSMLSQILTP